MEKPGQIQNKNAISLSGSTACNTIAS